MISFFNLNFFQADRIEALTETIYPIPESYMEHAANSRSVPDLKIVIWILFMEALNDDTALVSRSLDRVLQFLNYLCPEKQKRQTLSGIDEAKTLLRNKMVATENHPPTISHHFDILDLLNTNNENMAAIHRVITFVAGYIHFKLHCMPGYDKEHVIKMAEQIVKKHLIREPKDFCDLADEVKNVVRYSQVGIKC